MTQLQITREGDSLVCAGVGDSFEDDVGNGTTGEDVACDELVEDLEGNALVGDGLKHGQGDGQEGG
jgi:hypothetical protein